MANTSAVEEVKPTQDEQFGMAWWNRLTKAQRAEWMRRAGSAVPADAWAAFKLGQFGRLP